MKDRQLQDADLDRQTGGEAKQGNHGGNQARNPEGESAHGPGKDQGKKRERRQAEAEDWEEEPDAFPAKPWVLAAIFTGMLVLAALLCVVLWHFTHLGDGDKEPGQESIVQEDTDGSGQEGTGAEGQDVGGQADGQETDPGVSDPLEGTDPGVSDPLEGTDPSVSDPLEGTDPGSTGAEEGNAGAESPEGETTGTDAGTQDPVSGDKSMTFSDVQESVTPKDVINLRSVPSTADADTVVTQVANGVTLNRTGINGDTGWSRIEYNGQILYGVSQYLTTDLSYKPPVQASNPNRVNTQDGRVIIFTDCDDNVTPKQYVNLRTEPSTTEGETTISCQLNGGEVAHRTGYSADSGWSRVEYNGQVLYVVTSLVVVTE